MFKQFFTVPSLFLLASFWVSSVHIANGQTRANQLMEKIFFQAELQPQNHLNASGNPQLVILENGVRSEIAGLNWFDNPVIWLTSAEIRQQRRLAYVEFLSFNQLDLRKVALSFLVHCAESCAQYKHVYVYEFDAATNAWGITSNTSFYQR